MHSAANAASSAVSVLPVRGRVGTPPTCPEPPAPLPLVGVPPPLEPVDPPAPGWLVGLVPGDEGVALAEDGALVEPPVEGDPVAAGW